MPARRSRQKCPVCYGRKKTNQFLTKEESEARGEALTEMRNCPKCDGHGYILKPPTVEQRLHAVEKDVKRLRRRVKELENGAITTPEVSENSVKEWQWAPLKPTSPPKIEPQRQLP